MDWLRLMTPEDRGRASTSGDMPKISLDVLNQVGDSIEVALAKRFAARGPIPSARETPPGAAGCILIDGGTAMRLSRRGFPD